MARWQVQLSGQRIDLEELPRLFDQPAARVTDSPDGFILESESFEQLGSAREVREHASTLLPIINGAARLSYSAYRPAVLGGVYERTPSGRNVNVFPEPGEFRIKGGAVLVTASGSAPTLPPPAESNRWLTMAAADATARQVLSLLSKDPCTWVELYKVMEVLEAHDGMPLASSLGISNNELSRFSQTANSVHAIGDDARHAKNSIPAPKKPMTLPEAKRLIFNWARAWLTQRAGDAA